MTTPITSVLFVCNLNSVRSPMAAALLDAAAGSRLAVDSAGVYEGAPDPFVEGVLGEVEVSLEAAEPKEIADLDLDGFDLVVALTPRAVEALSARLPQEKIEHWEVDNPSDTYGSRDQVVAAYRAVRDDLDRRLRARFPEIYAAS